jgi:hypothetical protein
MERKRETKKTGRTETSRGGAPLGKRVDQALADIAKRTLDIGTLETRKSDSLDFHDLAVWNVRAALEAAFEAGMQRNR